MKRSFSYVSRIFGVEKRDRGNLLLNIPPPEFDNLTTALTYHQK